jgi:hypothetical protein
MNTQPTRLTNRNAGVGEVADDVVGDVDAHHLLGQHATAFLVDEPTKLQHGIHHSSVHVTLRVIRLHTAGTYANPHSSSSQVVHVDAILAATVPQHESQHFG